MVMDIRAEFGETYQIKMDESYAVEKRELRSANEPWYQELPGKYGRIYPCSDSEVAVAFTNTRGGKKKRDAFLSEVGSKARIHQNADDEIVYRVPNELAGKGIKAIKGKRNRQVTEERKKQLTESLRKARQAKIKKGGNEENTGQFPPSPPQMPPSNDMGFPLQ